MILHIGKLDKYYILTTTKDCNYEQNVKYGGLFAKIDSNENEDFGCVLDDSPRLNIIFAGVKDYKKGELDYLASKKLQEYLDSQKQNQVYYDLQKNAVLTYKLTNNSSLLSKIAEKKNISVKELVGLIDKKVEEHSNVIFNFKHVVNDLNNDIDQMTLDQLNDLNINKYLDEELYKKNHDLIDSFELLVISESNKINIDLDSDQEESKLSDKSTGLSTDEINKNKKAKLGLFKK